MTIPERVNHLITPFLKRRIARKFNAKLIPFKQSRPELFKPVDKSVVEKFCKLWGRLGLPVTEDWLRFYSNLSGIIDYRYLPEDLYITRVERVLNNCNRAGGEAEDKNQYSKFIQPEHQPRFVLRYIRGLFFDEEYKFVSDAQAKDILSKNVGDLIGKIAIESGGGHGIKGLAFNVDGYYDKAGMKMTTEWIRKNTESYVIQERVEQCDFSAQFNRPSANTCRIVTFRRPWNGVTSVIKAGMRFGASKDVFDNMSSGGCGICICADGCLGQIARNDLDPGLLEFTEHPTSHVTFAGQKHPYYEKMCEVACSYAERIPNFNLISWDFIADKNGGIKILEINETTQSTDWLQYDFGPFFGEETEELVDWCATYQRYDNFKHFRS